MVSISVQRSKCPVLELEETLARMHTQEARGARAMPGASVQCTDCAAVCGSMEASMLTQEGIGSVQTGAPSRPLTSSPPPTVTHAITGPLPRASLFGLLRSSAKQGLGETLPQRQVQMTGEWGRLPAKLWVHTS